MLPSEMVSRFAKLLHARAHTHTHTHTHTQYLHMSERVTRYVTAPVDSRQRVFIWVTDDLQLKELVTNFRCVYGRTNETNAVTRILYVYIFL